MLIRKSKKWVSNTCRAKRPYRSLIQPYVSDGKTEAQQGDRLHGGSLREPLQARAHASSFGLAASHQHLSKGYSTLSWRHPVCSLLDGDSGNAGKTGPHLCTTRKLAGALRNTQACPQVPSDPILKVPPPDTKVAGLTPRKGGLYQSWEECGVGERPPGWRSLARSYTQARNALAGVETGDTQSPVCMQMCTCMFSEQRL